MIIQINVTNWALNKDWSKNLHTDNNVGVDVDFDDIVDHIDNMLDCQATRKDHENYMWSGKSKSGNTSYNAKIVHSVVVKF